MAQKILDALSQPFDLDGHEVFVSSSIGIAVSPPSGDDVLVRDADAAMYRAKQLGRNNYQFYTPEMNAQVFERLAPEIRLRTALEREEFVLHYQPQVDLKTGQITGAEFVALASPGPGPGDPYRFQHSWRRAVYRPRGDWLCARLAPRAGLEDAGLPRLRIAVTSLPASSPAGVARQARSGSGGNRADPSRLELELTESLLMGNISVTIAMLDEMKISRVCGSPSTTSDCYSSLSYLKRFPLIP